MQIHELNNFAGTLGSGAYLAIDDGTDTGKISSQGLLAATEARIDNIIAGPAPSAEEIVDARLGADGVTYPSLGDAIRDQFSDVKSNLNSVVPTPDFIWTLGRNISGSGVEGNSGYYAVTDYMPISPSDGLVYVGALRDSGSKALIIYIHYYTATKGWISRQSVGVTESHVAVIPSNAAYYRINFGRASTTGVTISQSDITSYFAMKQYRVYAMQKALEELAPTTVLNDKVGAMVECAMTYFDKAYQSGANLIYQSGHGLFSNNIYSSIEGYETTPAIVCSQFANALIKGITYENSRYTLGASAINHMKQWGFMTDGSGTYPDALGKTLDYMWANQMYKYAVDKGFLHYPITAENPMLRPGDLVFKKNDAEPNNFYEHIVHVGLVIGVGYENGYVTTIESLDTTKLDGEKVGVAVRRDLITSWDFVATFPINDSICKAKLLYKDTDFATASSASTIKIIPINLPKGFYTLVLRGTVDDASVSNQNRFGYRYVGDNSTTGLKDMRNGNVSVAYIYIENSNFQDIRIIRGSNASYDISSFEIYKGYINPDVEISGKLL